MHSNAWRVCGGEGGQCHGGGVTEASSVRPSCPRVGGQRRRTVEFQSSEMEVAKLKVVAAIAWNQYLGGVSTLPATGKERDTNGAPTRRSETGTVDSHSEPGF